MRKTPTRPSLAEELAQLVDELLDGVQTRERWLRDKDKDTGKAVFTDHALMHVGLLANLEEVLAPTRPPTDEPGFASTFASRPPVRHEALELVDEITAGAAELRREMRGSGRRQGDSTTVTRDLRELVGLTADPATSLEAKLKTLRQVRTWVRRARVIVSHDAPILALRGITCPYCGSELRVRADASSDVWCSGIVRLFWCETEEHDTAEETTTHPPKHKGFERVSCVDDNGKRRTWSSNSWLMLLDRMHTDQPISESA